MTKYILHGGYTSADNDLNRTFYEEIARDVPDGGMILLCYFASRDADNSGRFREDSERILEQSHGKNFTFLLADEKEFMDQLKESNALYMRGGSTPKLLGTLSKFPSFKENLGGKTIVGSSAGAYAIGRYSAFHDDESGGKVREGLGLLPLRVICHYQSSDLPPNPDALVSLKATEPELELVPLKDFEWKVFVV
ncbi:MAG TPA: Type 1 glutamine amidotransferase-like domain-containing protein [Thermodesulfobacteriota bacterium]|nr:Type 1 glutamine amidotransferase-like domain-containing protein [Thermodesulfobacteriota bacterium]